MFKDKYLVFCTSLLAMLGAAQYFGWALSDYDTIPNVPNTVRSNPGSYRSHYVHHYSRIGGK